MQTKDCVPFIYARKRINDSVDMISSAEGCPYIMHISGNASVTVITMDKCIVIKIKNIQSSPFSALL